MTALCHPATALPPTPTIRPLLSRKDVPQNFRALPSDNNRCDLLPHCRLELRADSIDQDAPPCTNISSHHLWLLTDAAGKSASSASALSTRAQHDARSKYQGVTKRKRAEDIVGHSDVRGPRYPVSWERQTRELSPSASCCSRLPSTALCVRFRGSDDLDAKPWAIPASATRPWPPPTCCRALPCQPPTDTMATSMAILARARPPSAP